MRRTTHTRTVIGGTQLNTRSSFRQATRRMNWAWTAQLETGVETRMSLGAGRGSAPGKVRPPGPGDSVLSRGTPARKESRADATFLIAPRPTNFRHVRPSRFQNVQSVFR